MRKIKFRGKCKRTGEWLYGNLQVPAKEGVGYFMWDKEGFQEEVDPETIGEFTSLYDKNHNEIFEGDVIASLWGDGEPTTESLLEVRFVRGVFAFLWDGDLDDECPINAPTHEWATVVGNIHDNPDLIKNR